MSFATIDPYVAMYWLVHSALIFGATLWLLGALKREGQSRMVRRLILAVGLVLAALGPFTAIIASFIALMAMAIWLAALTIKRAVYTMN